MRTIIAGVRQVGAPGQEKRPIYYTEVQWMLDCISAYHKQFPITEVVSGNAPGSDRIGELWAAVNNVPVKKFIPDWDKLGKSAGVIRNGEMGRYSERAIVFWDQFSTGSKNMIEVMEELGKPNTVWHLNYFDM